MNKTFSWTKNYLRTDTKLTLNCEIIEMNSKAQMRKAVSTARDLI